LMNIESVLKRDLLGKCRDLSRPLELK
jgi:hypothetical protein